MITFFRFNLIIFSIYLMFPTTSCSWPIPDTGQTKCYPYGGDNSCPHLGEPFYGQDGNYLINPPSYTKLDANGNDLPDDAEEWVMVRDNVTGLIWEVKQDKDGIQDFTNPHDADNTYTWYDSDPETNGGDVGTPSVGTDTEDFVILLNSQKFGGFSDWRMPNREEFRSIVNNSRVNPSIDIIYFPNTSWNDQIQSRYWSGSSYARSTDRAWYLDFNGGLSAHHMHTKSDSLYVRAVRGKQYLPSNYLINNNDGTVTDSATGLMWQQTTNAQLDWESTLAYCSSLDLGGHNDWRTPNSKELASLYDLTSTYAPHISIEHFPTPIYNRYWSSTSNTHVPSYARHIFFGDGTGADSSKTEDRGVRAVRGGQTQIPGNVLILKPIQAAKWHIGDQKTITWETQSIQGDVRISLSRQGGRRGTFELLSQNTANDGLFEWEVTGPPSPNCVLKIEPIDDPSKGTSQSLFTIQHLEKAYIAADPVVDRQQYRLSFRTETTYFTTEESLDWTVSDPSVAELSGSQLSALKTGCTTVTAPYEGREYEKIVYFKTDTDQIETEPNNGIISATPLAETRFMQSNLPPDDADYFKMTLATDAIIEAAYFSNSPVADVRVEILDETQETLATAVSIDGEPLVLPTGLAAGDYYIKISPAGDVDQDSRYDVVFKTYEALPEPTDPQMKVGETRKDRLHNLADERQFSFSLHDMQAVFIDLVPSSPSAGYRVELRDGDGGLVRTADALNGNSISMENISGPGDYTVSITPNQTVDAENPFALRLTEHDFSIQTFDGIEAGETIQGQLSSDSDADYYLLLVPTPGYFDFSFGSQESQKAFRLSVYKDSARNLIGGMDSTAGEMATLPLGLNPGAYYIKIEKDDDSAETTLPYHLSLESSTQTDFEIEPNNTMAFASPIEADAVQKGRIFSSSDSDYYGFTLEAPSDVSIRFSSSSATGDYHVSLMDETDKLLQTQYIENGGSLTIDTAENPGNYYVKVEPGADVDSHALYELRIQAGADALSGLKPLVSIVIEGETAHMTVSETRELTALGGYPDGHTEPLDDVKWASLDPSIATVDETGLVKAIADGATAVVAVYGELAAKFDITVGAQTNAKRHPGNLILVAGGGAGDADTLKESTQYLCDLVYRRFLKRFFTDEDIYYFNPLSFHDLDGDGYDDGVVDSSAPTVTAFNSAIVSWAADQDSDGPLYLYLIDHGGVDAFKLFPGEILTAADLNAALDAFQEATGRRVVVMIEACKSGTFTDNLIADGKDRIIVTSTDHKDAYIQLAGNISFTQFFIDRLLAGDSVYHGWRRAVEKLVNMGVPYNMMRPQLVAGLTDIAAQTFLGGDFGIASLFPEFLDKTPDKEVSAGEALEIYAKVSDVDGIESVWARVLAPEYLAPDTSPDLEAPEVTTPIVPLQPTPEKDGTYTGTYAGFEYNGDYRFIFYARSRSGNTGTSPATSISVVNGKEFNRVAAPVFSVEPGTYISRATVHITCDTPNATIRYTLDGGEPTEASPEYTAPIVIQDIRALKAKAFRADWTESHTASGFYTVVEQLDAPTFTPAHGAYVVPQSVIISSHSPGAEIYYTTDGSTPNEDSLLYRSPIALNATAVLKARAYQIDWAPSDTATAEYIIDLIEKGDIDGDKDVDIGDVIVILRLLSGISVDEESLQNYLEAGHTDAVDLKEAIGAFRKAAGLK